MLDNSQIAELLAREAENAPPPADRALRRAARRAFLWSDEARDLVQQDRPLTELTGVGPYIARLIREWLAQPDIISQPPKIRSGFLSWTQARAILSKNPEWLAGIKGDLQMHTQWSDGEGSVSEMAEAGLACGYEYIAITDHSKGLKIAGGIDEAQLSKQGAEIDGVDKTLAQAGKKLRILKSVELNLNLRGEGDMDNNSLQDLDLVFGCFHSSLRRKEDQTERYIAALRNPSIQIRTSSRTHLQSPRGPSRRLAESFRRRRGTR